MLKKRNLSNVGRKDSIKTVIMRNLSGWLLLLPAVILFTMLVWRPMIISISYSFFELKGFTPVEFVGFKNFINVVTDSNFMKTLWNTMQYVLWSLIIGFPLPIICAIVLNELVHGQKILKMATYLPVIIPSIATSMIWRMVYMDGTGGLLNMIISFFGGEPAQWLSNKDLVIPLIIISMTWNGFGSTLITYFATLQGVNQELYEAARLDGAGVFGRFWHVLMPHMKGLTLLTFIRQIIGVFGILEQPMAMTGGGPNGASLSLGYTTYKYAFEYGQFGRSLALSVINFLILSIFTLMYFKAEKNSD